MQKYIEVTGKNDEEALAKGLQQLGLQRDDVSLEILERGRAGFLGIGSVPAKVRLTYEVPDEPAPEPAMPAPEAEKPAPKAESAPAPASPKAPAERRPREPRRGAPQPKAAPKAEKAAPVAEKPASPAESAPAQVGQAPEGMKEAIVAFQAGLFARMGVEASSKVEWDGNTWQVTLEGPDLGSLIGHRGETLDAIQQLTGYAVNRTRSHRVRIHVDAEGYRARREESLSKLARKMAGKAVRFRRNMALEPMNAYERHVIHTALQDYPGVSTRSSGVDPNRRVIVVYEPY